MTGKFNDFIILKSVLLRYSLVLELIIETSCFLSPNLRCIAKYFSGSLISLNKVDMLSFNFVKE